MFDPSEPTIRELIRLKAAKLSKQAGFTIHEREDLAQSLTAYLIKRLPALNARQSDVKAFVNTLLAQCASNATRDRYAAKRDYRRTRRLPPEAELADALLGADPKRDPTRVELALDIAGVVLGLPPDLRQLAQLLQRYSKSEIARQLGIPRHQVTEGVHRLREEFENRDLREYL